MARLINNPGQDSLNGKEIRLLDSDSQEVGIVPFASAIAKANDERLDLVEIAPDATPPVVRIMNYGKHIYEQKKRQKDARKKQLNHNQIKELKFHVNIHEHDLGTKLTHARQFLTKGYRLKITLQFRAREMAHPELGDELMERITQELAELGAVDSKPKLLGRNMAMSISPITKKG